MNDKQQLAAMGAQYRLTEEQAKGLAERMPQTGTLQILDNEPLCTEIRINGVEACGEDIGGLLDRCLPHTTEQQPLCMAKRIEETEFQKWCKRMLPYFQAAAEGKTVQVLINGAWSDKRAAGVRGPHREYRIKPDDEE